MKQESSLSKKTDIMTDSEKMRRLTDLTADNHIKRLSDGTVPERGKIKPHTNYFEIPGSKYLACIKIQSYFKDENKRQICLAVVKPDSIYSISVFDKVGTNNELTAYLKDDKTRRYFMDKFIELQNKWHEKEGEYPFG